MSNPGRWDRSFIRNTAVMPAKKRLEVERLLAKGLSGKTITKKLGLPLNTWVSAVKKNPIPGGLLDPKGKVAKYEGEWIDFDGVVREYKGLDSKGKPKPGLPIITKRGRKAKGGKVGLQKAQAKEVVRAPSPKAILPFDRKRARLDSAKPVSGDAPESTPTAQRDTGVPDAPGAMPNAQHQGTRADEDDALYDDKPKRGRGVKGRIAKLVQKHYPLKDRVVDLVALKTKALKDGETKLALDVIRTLNDMDGTTHAAKKEQDHAPSNAPLFAMPKGLSDSVAVGVTPVGPVPLRLDSEEDEAASPSEDDAAEPAESSTPD